MTEKITRREFFGQAAVVGLAVLTACSSKKDEITFSVPKPTEKPKADFSPQAIIQDGEGPIQAIERVMGKELVPSDNFKIMVIHGLEEPIDGPSDNPREVSLIQFDSVKAMNYSGLVPDIYYRKGDLVYFSDSQDKINKKVGLKMATESFKVTDFLIFSFGIEGEGLQAEEVLTFSSNEKLTQFRKRQIEETTWRMYNN